MNSVFAYFIRVGDAISQLINVVFFLGENPNESVSGRAYRQRNLPAWKVIQKGLDLIFWAFEKEHCRLSYETDLARAKKTIEEAS